MANEVDKFKQGFFDRGAVIDAVGRATATAMMKTGGYTRKVARNSMKKKKGQSAPGTPPNVHQGSLKNFLFFAYDKSTQSLVVGPVGFKGSIAPRLLEFGQGKTAARHYMRPAMQKSIDKFAPSLRFGVS